MDELIDLTKTRLAAVLKKDAKDDLVLKHHLEEIKTLTETLATLLVWRSADAHNPDE